MLEELSFHAHRMGGQTVVVDAAFVDSQMQGVVDDATGGHELAKFIL